MEKVVHKHLEVTYKVMTDFMSINMPPVKGFADDTAVVPRVPDIYTPIERGQEATQKAMDFERRNGLEFEAEKTKVVIFT